MSADEILKKLRFKGGKAIVLNAPEGYELGLEAGIPLPDKLDFVLFYAQSAQEVRDGMPRLIPLLHDSSVAWIAYPKQSSKRKSDINRDRLFELLNETTEYRIVSNVAIDEVWSAVRFRHRDQVKSKG